jgi:hypothetical protein
MSTRSTAVLILALVLAGVGIRFGISKSGSPRALPQSAELPTAKLESTDRTSASRVGLDESSTNDRSAVPAQPAVIDRSGQAGEQQASKPQQSKSAEFLPYPNGGAAAFESKYAGLSVEQLEKVGRELQGKLNENLNTILEGRITGGLVDQVQDFPTANGTVAVDSEEPKGMGRVWKTTRYEPTSGGMIAKVVYVTEARYPELFDQKAEYEWVAGQWIKKSAAHK